MSKNKKRLYFIDAMRAWAILMMLQGHFIDGLLDPIFRDNSNVFYSFWKYFRGITAPVFFTVSGFIFTFLLIKSPIQGFKNPRVKKGFIRGLQLIGFGYLLRINLLGLLHGEIYEAFYLIDVLHCIGLSLLGILGVYLLTSKQKTHVFPFILGVIGGILFILEPIYANASFTFLPQFIANYFAKNSGSVFTIIPWFGYTALGGLISVLFNRYKEKDTFYPVAITGCFLLGLTLIFFSSEVFMSIHNTTGIALFMTARKLLTNKTLITLGQSTLSIYIIHFIILYGSFTGLGLYRFFSHSVPPSIVIPGAILFMFTCSYLALQYEKRKEIVTKIVSVFTAKKIRSIEPGFIVFTKLVKSFSFKVLRLLGLLKN